MTPILEFILSPRMFAARSGHADIARLLVEAEANKDLANNDGLTALMILGSPVVPFTPVLVSLIKEPTPKKGALSRIWLQGYRGSQLRRTMPAMLKLCHSRVTFYFF